MASDNLRNRIAEVLRDRLLNEIEGAVNGVDNIYVGDWVGDSAIHLTPLADAVIEALDEHQKRETCGGCRGLGGHSPRCHTQPGALWRRLADMAESLGDQIGGNDTTLANQAYDLMVSLRVRGGL